MNERVVLPSFVTPILYNLSITPNLSGDFKYSGDVDIHLSLKSDSQTYITLHSKQLELHNCTYKPVNGKPISNKRVTYDETTTTATIEFSSLLPDGEAILSIGFTGTHNNQMTGFYRSGYLDGKGENKIMVSTQFEALEARRCFPCIDEPARKAKFECSLTVDKSLTALSNMPVEKTTAVEGDKVRYDFQVTPKMSTYLLAFCVGEFDYVETKTKNNVQLRVYTPPNKNHLGNFALNIGAKALDLYDDMFGIPFPLPKMDMIAIPEFAAGAMENWGLVTYREVEVLIDDLRASSEQKQRVCIVVTHELAHQWFGNLVTMAWWDDLWLNEGFASWMENYCANDIFPEWQLWDQFIGEQQAGALGLDSLLTSHPIQVPIKHAEEVDEVFDTISYYKGACVVRLVHAFLGHDNFVKGLQLYMKKHQYANTETYDLWNAWETATSLPVSELMASWTEQMGFPLLEVTAYEYKEKEKQTVFTVRQRWFLADGSQPEEGKDKLWAVPMFVSTQNGVEQLELLRTREKEYKVKGKVDFLKINGEQYVPLRVKYNNELYSQLTEAIKQKKLSVGDRTGLIMDTYALTKSGDLDAAVLLELISAYKNETEYTVWEALSAVLNGVHDILVEEPELKKQFMSFAADLVVPLAEKVGWDSKKTDGHLDRLLRSVCINLLTKFASDNEKVLAEARSRFSTYVSDVNHESMSKVLPTDYRRSVLRMVLKTEKGVSSYESLMKLLEGNAVEDLAEKIIILGSVGFVNDLEKKKEVLDWCTSGKVKLQDFFYPMASVCVSTPEGLDLSWGYLKKEYGRITEMISNANVSIAESVISCCANGYTSYEKAEEIEQFFKENKTRAERGVSQLVEATRNRAAFKERVFTSVAFKSFLS